jgi:RNA recognition motif-containing protein
MSSRNSKLFISGLAPGVQQKDIIDLFSRHGRVIACSLKNGYAFVVSYYSGYMHRVKNLFYFMQEFSHPDDADDAIRGLDGYIYHGKKLLVQLAVQKGKPLSPSRDMSRNRIYVGGLTEGVNMRELEEVFSEVGHVVRTVDKKSFAFLVCLYLVILYCACRYRLA